MSLYLGDIIIEVSSIAAINLWYYELWIIDMINFLVQINTVHQEMRTIFHKVEEEYCIPHVLSGAITNDQMKRPIATIKISCLQGGVNAYCQTLYLRPLQQ